MKRIVVIGAGYTGLTAALRLAQAGYKVEILERGSFIGGLASEFKVEGASLERAYHHLFKTDKNIIDLADELGIAEKLEWHNSSVSIYYDGSIYSFVTPIDLLKFKPLRFHNRFRAGLAVLYLQRTKNWKQFQNITAYEWMKKWSGEEVTKVIWEPLLKGKFSQQYYKKVSMAWLWARIHIRANSKEKGDTSEKLGYFNGGFQVFTDTLVQELEKLGVTIHTESEIKSIGNTKDGMVRIEFSDHSYKKYHKCVVTTPSHVFSRLIENSNVDVKYLNQLNSVEYLGARLLIFSSEQDLSPYYWHNMNDVKLPFLVFINHTKLISKDFYNGKNIYYLGAYLPHKDKLFLKNDKDLEEVWFESLKSIFKNFDTTQISEKHHFRFPNAQHIVDLDYSKKIPKHNTPLENVYLSNFSQIYPEDRGTNYAIREGENISKIIIDSP